MSASFLAAQSEGAAPGIAIDSVVGIEEAEVGADDAAGGDDFGTSCALDGDLAVVGSPADDDVDHTSGSAYVYRRDGTSWSQEQKLTADDAAGQDAFGSAVGISGDTVVVGSPYDDDGGNFSGAAYVFVRDGTSWSQQAKLTAPDASPGDFFGSSVAISGDTIVAGAPYGDSPSTAVSGAAYVFVRAGTTWSDDGKLVPSQPGVNNEFGCSVAIDPTTIVVGERLGEAPFVLDAGAAYAFVKSFGAWAQQTKLNAPDASMGDDFGASVSFDVNTAVIGATFGDHPNAPSSGSAYVFTRGILFWGFQAELNAGDPALGDGFGSSVSIQGDVVLIGAPDDDDDGSSSGSAYLFARDGASWSERDKLTASDAGAGDLFGACVSFDGDMGVVGAEAGDTPSTNDSGSTYAYRIGPNGAELCADANVIAGDGSFPFDNTGASTDGPPHAACGGDEQVSSDLWYCWVAPCNAEVSVETCGQTGLDTKLTVYAGHPCPPEDADVLDCDDDTCGAQSSASFTAVAGSSYLIRVGSAGSGQGSGTFTITVECIDCPSETVASTQADEHPLRAARMLRRLYRLRDDVLGETPLGRRWTERYYRHAGEVSRILREDPTLLSRATTLLDLLGPGIDALSSEERDVRVPEQVVTLFAELLRGVEEATVDPELARTIREERRVLGLRRLAGRTYAEAWERINAE